MEKETGKFSSDSPITMRLWTRFTAILFVLGLLSVGSQLLTEWLIVANESSNAVVNISGRQRMLSQRITLLAEKLNHTQYSTDRGELKNQLLEAIDLMEKSHLSLTNAGDEFSIKAEMSEQVAVLYFGPKTFVDRDVKRFIALARNVAAEKKQDNDHLSIKMSSLYQMSDKGLLANLDGIVKQYQLEGEARVNDLKLLGTISLIIFITALVALAVSVFKPLVDRVQKEFAEKENTQRLLAASECRQRTIVESALDGVITIDKEGRVVEFNSSALSTFGFADLDEVKGIKLEDLIIPAESHQQHQEGMARFLETGESVILDRRVEVMGEHKNGTPIPLELAVTGFRIEGEQFFTAFIRDLTEKKRADTEKNLLEERLHQAQKMETMGTLSGGIAHDFNNLLTPIVGYLQLLLRKAGEDEDLKMSLTRVLRAADKATNLVSQILTFSRQTNFEKKPILPSPLLEETLKLLQSTLPSSINFEQKIEDDCPPILGDPSRVQQVIMNLCTNAAHAIEEGKGNITVELKTIILNEREARLHHDLDAGKHVKLVVSDTGKGMNEEVMLKIFDPFFTTKRHSGGTGLGLASCHGIITEMRGEITVESAPGKGATFTVYFPITTFEEEGVDEDGAVDLAGSGTVLVVDDVEENVALIGEMLEALGYGVKGFHHSLEAIDYFKNNPYKVDVILTDQEMPGMTGDALARLAKEIRPEIPIILMTGYSEKISGKNPLDQGLSDILKKPLTIESLGMSIKGAFH